MGTLRHGSHLSTPLRSFPRTLPDPSLATEVMCLDPEPVHRVERPDDQEVVGVGRREPAPLHPILQAVEVTDDRKDDAANPRRLIGRYLIPVQVPLPSPSFPKRLTVPLG